MRFLAVKPLAVTPRSIINVIVILLLLYAAYVLDYLLFQFYDPFTKKRQTISFVVYKTSFGLTCLPLVIGNENTQIWCDYFFYNLRHHWKGRRISYLTRIPLLWRQHVYNFSLPSNKIEDRVSFPDFDWGEGAVHRLLWRTNVNKQPRSTASQADVLKHWLNSIIFFFFSPLVSTISRNPGILVDLFNWPISAYSSQVYVFLLGSSFQQVLMLEPKPA